MLDVRNCPRCGRVFAYRGKDVCPQCEREEEEMFDRVRLFLRQRPGATLEEVEEATEVPAEIVLGFLRQGRLLATGGLTGVLSCERCGSPIDRGFLCEKCSRQLSRQIADQVGQTIPRSSTAAPSPGTIGAPGGASAGAAGGSGTGGTGTGADGPGAGGTREPDPPKPTSSDRVKGRMYVADIVKRRSGI